MVPIFAGLSVSKSLKVLPSEVALGVCLSQIHMHGFRHLILSTDISSG